MTPIFAGFYCSPEESAQYTDDKIITALIWLALFVGMVYVIRKIATRSWVRAWLILLALAVATVSWMVTMFMVIPWGC